MLYAIKEVDGNRFVADVHRDGLFDWSGRLNGEGRTIPLRFNSVRSAVEAIHYRGVESGKSGEFYVVKPNRMTIVGIEEVPSPRYAITEL